VDELIAELRWLIVEGLKLAERPGYEGITPEQIDPDAPLFVEGLALDSIDALALGVAIAVRYGVLLAETSEEAAEIYTSVRTLAAYVARHRDPVVAGPTAEDIHRKPSR
jgi:acyl carrier protein